jgi:hypothetical protein
MILSLLLSVALAQPRTEIEEFRSGPGPDKSTLIVVCASGRRIEIILTNKFIKERNVDAIFEKIVAQCDK